ncbi:MAG: hypothetical protein J5J00_01095 [Deltaproteobacteria bacterium]|nr:hypothetical protein [Deltaproteobacteria bacterium]
MSMISALLLSAAAAWYVFRPLIIENSPAAVQNVSGRELKLLDAKQRLVQMLRDLELDRSTDKMSEQEYDTLKRTLSLELASILKELDGPTKDA